MRYVDRSDLFDNARIEDLSADGKSGTMAADVIRVRFLFGTDGNGRDLLARILIGIRISLAIGAARLRHGAASSASPTAPSPAISAGASTT